MKMMVSIHYALNAITLFALKLQSKNRMSIMPLNLVFIEIYHLQIVIHNRTARHAMIMAVLIARHVII